MADCQIEYYTHNPLATLPIKIVAKYVPLDIPEGDITDDLKSKELPFIKIARVMTTKDGKRVASNILLITVTKEAAPQFYKLTEICNLKVTISPYNSPALSQCHNCQQFAHSSEICGRISRCVRCGQTHRGVPCKAESCKRANCGGDHPANYRGCPASQAALDRYNPTQRQQQPPVDKPASARA